MGVENFTFIYVIFCIILTKLMHIIVAWRIPSASGGLLGAPGTFSQGSTKFLAACERDFQGVYLRADVRMKKKYGKYLYCMDKINRSPYKKATY